MDGDALKAKNASREQRAGGDGKYIAPNWPKMKQERITPQELFGREFEASPKPLTYKGSPVDKEDFFKTYAKSADDRYSNPKGGLRIGDNEMLVGVEGKPTLVRLGDDGTINFVDGDTGMTDTFNSVDEMLDGIGVDQKWDKWKSSPDKDAYGVPYYSDDVNDEKWADVYNQYKNWRNK